MRPCAAGASKPPLLSRRRSLSTLMRERPPSGGPASATPRPSPALACAGRDLALEVNCGSLCARDHATMDLIAARRQLAEMGKAATEGWGRTSACRNRTSLWAWRGGVGRNALCHHPESLCVAGRDAGRCRVARHSHEWRVLSDFWPENADAGCVPSLIIGGAPL
jgi:hypothetical protein